MIVWPKQGSPTSTLTRLWMLVVISCGLFYFFVYIFKKTNKFFSDDLLISACMASRPLPLFFRSTMCQTVYAATFLGHPDLFRTRLPCGGKFVTLPGRVNMWLPELDKPFRCPHCSDWHKITLPPAQVLPHFTLSCKQMTFDMWFWEYFGQSQFLHIQTKRDPPVEIIAEGNGWERTLFHLCGWHRIVCSRNPSSRYLTWCTLIYHVGKR